MLLLFGRKFLYTFDKLPVDDVELGVILLVESFFSKKYCSSFKSHILHHAYDA